MKIKIKVISKSSKNKVADDCKKVYVVDPPEHGKANKTVISLIAKFFHISKCKVKIVSGFSSQTKIIEIDN